MSTEVAQPRLALTKSIWSISDVGPTACAPDRAVLVASLHERPPSCVVHRTAVGWSFPVSPRANPTLALMKCTNVAGGSARCVHVRPPSAVANKTEVPTSATKTPSRGEVNAGAPSEHPEAQSNG